MFSNNVSYMVKILTFYIIMTNFYDFVKRPINFNFGT